jgi:hypothetical protein
MEKVDVTKFKNYWEVYAYAKSLDLAERDFNLLMADLRNRFLEFMKYESSKRQNLTKF